MVAPFPRDLEKVIGGVEAATLAVARALAAHPSVEKVLVAAIDITGRGPGRQIISQKLEVQFLRPVFLLGDTLLQSVQLLPALRALARRFRPDVVHGQGLGREGRLAVRMGRPAVITVHGLIDVEAHMAAGDLVGRLRASLVGRSVRRVLQGADVVISISDYDARALTGRARSWVSIPNAVPAEFFQAARPSPNQHAVLFAGVMVPRKNVSGLVNAFAKVVEVIPTATLQIAGPPVDTAYFAAVNGRVKDLGLSGAVTFLGHVSNARLVQAIDDCAVLAMFSLEETLPTIIAQAMAVGRPVVTSEVGGIGEMVVDGQTGWKVASCDEEALAKRLIQVLSDPKTANEMGARAGEAARARYTAAAIADRTIAAYETAVNARREG